LLARGDGGALTGIVRGVSGSASAAWRAPASRARKASPFPSSRQLRFGNRGPEFLEDLLGLFLRDELRESLGFDAASLSRVKPASAKISAVFFEIPRLRKA